MTVLGCLKSFSAAALTLGLCWPAIPAQADVDFTKDQARAGRAAYREHCASCHGARLEGIHLSPALTGSRFDEMWRGRSADILFFHLNRMPPASVGEPGSLGDETYANILSYILMSNGFEPGDKPLPASVDTLSALDIPNLPGAKRDALEPVKKPSPDQAARLNNLAPVTQKLRENPPPEDWLQWGRAYAGHGFSPLTQIDRDNVGNLGLAWRKPLAPGPNMPAPLVHDGILYLYTFPDSVVAMDATNGDVLWRYKRSTVGNQKIGITIHKNKVIMPASDMHVVALDAKTGELIWEHAIEVEAQGFRLRSAPLVVRDIVMQGVTASFAPGGGFITGIDANTGEELWRFYTIARPGEPGGNTWNDVPLEKRSGGSVWHQGTYDPELDLAYFGVAPTYDTGPLMFPIDKEGVNNDALYTNCTIALDPDTGELVWQYQHLANDQWDLDWAFERQIVELEVDGEPRKVVMNVGKVAVLDALDAATGEYLFSVDAGVQDFIVSIDPETGEKTTDPDKLPSVERPCVVCPSAHGARSWPPTSYSPRTQMLYLPLTEFCMKFGEEGVKLLTSGTGISIAPHPDAEDGMLGRLQAIDVANAELGWNHDLPMPVTSSVLSTAGGLVFAGDAEPSLKAFDAETGEQLWRAVLDDNPSSSIISYAVDGTQYIAVVVGAQNLHVEGLMESVNEFAPKDSEFLDRVEGGAALWVFALNESV